MRLGRQTQGIHNEAEMSRAFSRFLTSLDLTFTTEHHVPEVKRRADFLIIKNGLINVEAKCHDYKTMMMQLEDHSIYCDYCFAFIPDYSFTPKWFKARLRKRGFGLIVYNNKNKQVTEVLEAHHNYITEPALRRKVLSNIRNTYLEPIHPKDLVTW